MNAQHTVFESSACWLREKEVFEMKPAPCNLQPVTCNMQQATCTKQTLNPMRKLIVLMNVTLDGFMAGPDCELDWHFERWGPEMAESLSEELGKADTILLGRVTYNAMAAYWPMKLNCLDISREDIAFADMMNNHWKVVFSKTLHETQWNNSRIVKGDLASEILKMKRDHGKDMILFGSGKLVTALIQEDLVDEYRLWIHPILLGRGKPFFNAIDNRQELRLIERKSFSSGVVVLKYSRQTHQINSTMTKTNFKNIDEYIATFPEEIQEVLQDVRITIHKAAPEAEEAISYQMPTFKLNGNLVHFAAWKNHIGFYPTPSGTKEFQKEIAKYAFAKGSIQFPLNEPMPLALITKIVKFRVKESQRKVPVRPGHPGGRSR